MLNSIYHNLTKFAVNHKDTREITCLHEVYGYTVTVELRNGSFSLWFDARNQMVRCCVKYKSGMIGSQSHISLINDFSKSYMDHYYILNLIFDAIDNNDSKKADELCSMKEGLFGCLAN